MVIAIITFAILILAILAALVMVTDATSGSPDRAAAQARIGRHQAMIRVATAQDRSEMRAISARMRRELDRELRSLDQRAQS